MTIKRLLGSAPSQVSRNKDLGSMAFQDASNVSTGNLTVTGNLGVGTSSPTTKLEVSGSGKFYADVNSVGLYTSGALRHTGTGGFYIDCNSGGSANTINFRNGSTYTTHMIIDASGILLVGKTTATGTAKLQVESPINFKGYTVATLPAGTVGDRAYVTDATAPTFLGTLTGGGAVKCPVFYNGTAWVAG